MSRLPLRHPGVVVIIILGFMLLPMSTDMYLASLPELRRYFDVTVPHAQLTLSVFVVAFALSQLAYGPLSDRFGRRPLLLAGIGIYVTATLGCMTAQSIEWLIVARFFQGMGACASTVIGRAIIRDIYGGAGAARTLGYVLAGTSMAPIFGPMLGGVLEAAFGWRANFAALLALGSVLLVSCALLLGESNVHRDPSATQARQLAANYLSLLRSRRFNGFMLCFASGYCAIFTWLSMSAFVLIGALGLSPQRFGMLFGLTVPGYLFGTLIAARLATRVGVDRLVGIGSVVTTIAGCLMAGLAIAGVHHIAALLLPMALLLCGTGLINPAATAGAIAPFPKIAGTASALLGFAQMATGAAYGFLAAQFHDGTSLAMACAIGLSSLGSLAAYLLLVRGSRPTAQTALG
jgi:DHA1 family bicyclomycin/chloramphenicol resistance-like MFS transporter